jgi:hypothetical protein
MTKLTRCIPLSIVVPKPNLEIPVVSFPSSLNPAPLLPKFFVFSVFLSVVRIFLSFLSRSYHIAATTYKGKSLLLYVTLII